MLLDNCIQWCREYKLYAWIDLHAAPGGQGGAERGDHDGLLSLGRDAGYGQCPVTLFGGSASLNFDDSIMTAPTYAAVARTLRFCRLSFRFAEESVGIEVLP